jgi:hypothetical protein
MDAHDVSHDHGFTRDDHSQFHLHGPCSMTLYQVSGETGVSWALMCLCTL